MSALGVRPLCCLCIYKAPHRVIDLLLQRQYPAPTHKQAEPDQTYLVGDSQMVSVNWHIASQLNKLAASG
ncbi:uncharacterized protein LAJ45_06987 [Morchella importuna]|uniref:uncharacterized protein n=1 Tax=Morchella importuna TaxID=1174673 RepID=UPI001E8D999A|nr:uncharacterized protein LAJ45_06987 [Morchella importuna]KAH8149012.1 hypothetical protein LAJ45_06987 [Morchella importuna]